MAKRLRKGAPAQGTRRRSKKPAPPAQWRGPVAAAVLVFGLGLGFLGGHWWAGREAPAPATAPAAAPALGRIEVPAGTGPSPVATGRPETPPAATAPGEQAALPPPAPGPRVPTGPAWLRYAAAAPEAGGRPMVAVVIDDLGMDLPRTERAIALAAPLTLSFLPQGFGLEAQAEAVRAAGHELMVHVPMEPESTQADPGANALVAGLGRDEVLGRLRWALGRFEGFVGINNHMGSLFTRDAEAMTWVLEEVKARGLLFLDSRTTAETTGARVAAGLGVPHAERDVFLDGHRGKVDVRARLEEVERTAREQGTAIALGHPHDATLEALAEWLPTLEARGLVQVPVSAVVRRLMRAPAAPTAARAGPAG